VRPSILWFLVAVALLVAATGTTVTVEQARLLVHWAPSTTDENRAAIARMSGLVQRRPVPVGAAGDEVESFVVLNPRTGLLPSLRANPAVAAVEVVSPDGASLNGTFGLAAVTADDWLFDWQAQSTVLLLLAALLCAGAAAAQPAARMAATVGCVLLLTLAAFLLPLDSRIHMGDVNQYTQSRPGFENAFPDTHVNFQSHLASRLVWWFDRQFGEDEASPAAAMNVLSRVATVWFAVLLLVAAALDRFSPFAVRYVALAIAAPASIMYFGYRELGYLSLSPLVFPLIAQGLSGWRSRLELGSASAGLGAALHGFGVLSIVGSAAAALTAPGPTGYRLGLFARVLAFGTALYLGWVVIYAVGQGLTIAPGHAGEIPWRSLTDSTVLNAQVNWAVASPRGALEILAACWMVGVPILLAALASTTVGERRRIAFAFAGPSFLFLIFIWPIQGLAVEADLLVAAFPAVYALAWVAAHSTRGTVLALLLLASSHVVFWRVLFSDAFVASRL
jgi:hypothetical protein